MVKLRRSINSNHGPHSVLSPVLDQNKMQITLQFHIMFIKVRGGLWCLITLLQLICRDVLCLLYLNAEGDMLCVTVLIITRFWHSVKTRDGIRYLNLSTQPWNNSWNISMDGRYEMKSWIWACEVKKDLLWYSASLCTIQNSVEHALYIPI